MKAQIYFSRSDCAGPARGSRVADAKSPNASYSFTELDAPFPGTTGSRPDYISVNGTIVGLYFDGSGAFHGYLDDKGVFTTIDVPFTGATGTCAGAINTNNLIVGGWNDSAGAAARGFFDDKGVFTSFDPPGSISTSPLYLNPAGTVVGEYCDPLSLSEC
jgi:hypothetical protein